MLPRVCQKVAAMVGVGGGGGGVGVVGGGKGEGELTHVRGGSGTLLLVCASVALCVGLRKQRGRAAHITCRECVQKAGVCAYVCECVCVWGGVE